MRNIGNVMGLAGTLAAVVAVIAVCIGLWAMVGDSEISGAGWAAMIFGVVATLAVGIGLMTLIFISNRRGYDELDRPSH